MSIQAPGYNVEGSPSAGFMKNDGAGNFLFGEAGGGGGGGVGTGWELIEVKDITVDATTVTFSGLDGDVDGEYMMLFRLRTPLASIVNYTIEPNGISASQNTIRRTTVAATTTTATFPTLNFASAGNVTIKQWIGVVHLDAKTGTTARQIVSNSTTRLTGLTVATGGLRRSNYGGSWDDTVTNITSLDIVSDLANGIGAGSQLCLYKKSSQTGNGGIQLIETIDVAAPTTSVSFAGLDGDTDKLYKLVWKIVAAAGPPDLTSFELRPNGVTVGLTQVSGFHSSSGGHGSGLLPSFRLASGPGVSLPYEAFGETLIDAESNPAALARHFNTKTNRNVPGFPSFITSSLAGFWSDVATNITSLDIVASDALRIEPGSYFSLYRVNK